MSLLETLDLETLDSRVVLIPAAEYPFMCLKGNVRMSHEEGKKPWLSLSITLLCSDEKVLEQFGVRPIMFYQTFLDFAENGKFEANASLGFRQFVVAFNLKDNGYLLDIDESLSEIEQLEIVLKRMCDNIIDVPVLGKVVIAPKSKQDPTLQNKVTELKPYSQPEIPF